MNNMNLLKSTDFPMKNESQIVRDDDTVSIKSYVDAENGFGATVRTTFVVKLDRDSGDLIDINITE